MYRSLKWILIAVLFGSQSHAETGPDTNGDIVVRARTAIIQQQEGVAEYVGNAELVQGNRILKADRILIHLLNNEPQRIEATGEPVSLTEGDDLEASAGRLVYDMSAGRIWLFDQARVASEGRLFEGAELEYELSTRQVNARSDGEQDRVRLVIPAEPGSDEGLPE